jgi:serine/threonine-protein kinase
MLQPGDPIGAYRILEPIGDGAMGAVYLAEHVRIGRRVAIKTIKPALARDADALELFFREACAANQIAHPNIIQITDLCDGDGDQPPFMVMEHLDGFTLREVLDQEGKLEPYRALEIAGALSEAMAAAHSAGVIHRDLKPDNVFLCSPRGAVKVVDFGIAQLAGTREIAGARIACGTPLYISPEQAGADEIDHRSDIYSLGALLYETLAGRPVFEHDSVRRLLTAHIADLPEELLLTGLGPTRLAALVMRCIEKAPEDRPRCMAAINDELRDIASCWSCERDPQLDRLLDGMWDGPPPRRLVIAA